VKFKGSSRSNLTRFSKHIAVGILVLTITSSSFAQTKIYITGSTAFRTVTVNGIGTILSGAVSIAYDGLTPGVTSPTNANAVTWTGGNIGGTAVTIRTSWSGSASGIQTVAGAPNFFCRAFSTRWRLGIEQSECTTAGQPRRISRAEHGQQRRGHFFTSSGFWVQAARSNVGLPLSTKKVAVQRTATFNTC
jgi:hypothetical protein